MIFTHARDLNRTPFPAVTVEHQRSSQAIEQRLGRIVAEDEAVRLRSASVVSDGISKAADFADNGDGAVSEAVHLIQPAWLEARRHEEDVRAAFDEMRRSPVEPDPHADACRCA